MHWTFLPTFLAVCLAACNLAPETHCATSELDLDRLAPAEARGAVAAARLGLSRYLDLIPEGQSASYGFSDRAEIERARLGVPYRLWMADPAKVERDDPAALTPTTEWRFPVLVDGSFRALLTVAPAGSQMKAVDFGAAGLARELGAVEQQSAIAPESLRVLLRLHRLQADLVAFPARGAPAEALVFHPLASARALPQAPVGAVDTPRLLPWLRERFHAVPVVAP